jgi:antibiotic biosynthesis monooxygenase (ABM) superfamily enzyme
MKRKTNRTKASPLTRVYKKPLFLSLTIVSCFVCLLLFYLLTPMVPLLRKLDTRGWLSKRTNKKQSNAKTFDYSSGYFPY